MALFLPRAPAASQPARQPGSHPAVTQPADTQPASHHRRCDGPAGYVVAEDTNTPQWVAALFSASGRYEPYWISLGVSASCSCFAADCCVQVRARRPPRVQPVQLALRQLYYVGGLRAHPRPTRHWPQWRSASLALGVLGAVVGAVGRAWWCRRRSTAHAAFLSLDVVFNPTNHGIISSELGG